MNKYSVSEARAVLPKVIEQVQAGEEVVLTRHGRPVAVVIKPEALRPRRADEALATAERVGELLKKGSESRLDPRGGRISRRKAAVLISDVRNSRSAR